MFSHFQIQFGNMYVLYRYNECMHVYMFLFNYISVNMEDQSQSLNMFSNKQFKKNTKKNLQKNE